MKIKLRSALRIIISRTNLFASSAVRLRLLLVCSLAGIFVPGAVLQAAAPPPIQFTFSESYTEKLLSTKIQGVVQYFEDAADIHSLKAICSLNGIDLSGVTPDTRVDLVIGKLEIHQRLGDDPKYKLGSKKAKLTSVIKDAKNKAVCTRTITISWTAKSLTVMCSGATRPFVEGAYAAVSADAWAGVPTGIVTSNTAASLTLGPATFTFPSLPVTGKILTKQTKAKDHSLHSLSAVKIAAKGPGTYSRTPVRADLHNNQIAESKLVEPNTGGNLSITQGPLAGTHVTIPPGAISENATFTLSSTDVSVTPRSGTSSGRGIDISTDGPTDFQEPLRITVPINPDGSLIPVPYYLDSEGYLQACQVVGIDRQAGTMTFETFHASPYTWITALLTGGVGSTNFKPASDGFQVVNYGSVYNPGGECFGFAAFAQWYFRHLGGGLYSKYMEDIPLGTGGGTVKGQQVIATRAHTSLSRLWTSYVPRVSDQLNLTGTEIFASIKNVLDNTSRPAILYLNDSSTDAGSHASHAVLAYDHNDSDQLKINDPNHRGEARTAALASGNLTYETYRKVRLIGDGSLQKEPLRNIYLDAELGFSGNGAAQINISSHTDGQTASERTVNLSGTIESGQVLVSQLDVILNGSTLFRTNVSQSGYFNIPVSLVSGENRFTFVTKGVNLKGDLIEVPNTSLLPFKLLYNNSATVLVTLSWNTNNTDIDLCVVDPTGDYSAYYHKTTADGGALDYDNTSGYGPEHFTLLSTNTIRWGQPYKVRAHYYSDHAGSSSGSALSTRWTVTVLLYEGTQRAQTFTYTGTLATDNSGNTGPLATGADWADVCTVTPVQEGVPAAATLNTRSLGGGVNITVPIPSLQQRLLIKQQNEAKE